MNNNLISIIFLFIIYIQCSSLSFQENLLIQIFEKNEKKNIMISPLGIYQILSLLANGAEGETQKEILQLLFPNQQIKDNNIILNKINSNFEEILSNISSENPSSVNIYPEDGKKNTSINKLLLKDFDSCEGDCNLVFNNINGLFANKKFNILEGFNSICKKYNTSIHELIDAKQINEFCYNNTNGKIKEIIKDINKDIALILINAIYFKGSWLNPFNKEKTSKLPFENDNNIIEVDTMYKYFDDIMYYGDEDIQAISLPYISKKLKFKMVIMLPNKTKYSSPLNYIKTKNTLKEIISKLKRTKKVNLFLPKFDYDFSVPLKNILNDMNMKEAFSTKADFRKIFGVNNIKIDEIIHKTFIKIDEEGTEAAAITDSILLFGARINRQEPIYMHVNSSFIYALISDEIKDFEGNYLMPFIGLVNNLKGNIIKNKINNEENKNNNPDNSNKTLVKGIINFENDKIRVNERKNLTVIKENNAQVKNFEVSDKSNIGRYIIFNKLFFSFIILILY